MAKRIDSVRKKASGSLEVAVSGGFVFCFDEVDAQLLDYSLKTHPSDLPFSGKYFLDVHSPAEHSVDALARHSSAVHLIAADSIEFSESAIAGHYGPKSILLFQDESIDEDSLLLLGRLNDLHRARSDALLIVSHNEQASRQLYLKLLKRGYEPEIANTCVRWTCAEHYVDDRRYVRMLFKLHCFKKGQGPTRMQALAWPRIGLFESPQTILADGMAAIPEDDLMEAIKKNIESYQRKPSTFSRLDLNSNSSEKRTFLRSFLRRQGFPYQSIERFLETLVEKEHKND
ncbi:MAG: hypothetical protein GX469_02855 [Treponema sp.]|nr:hypothetical protein [Treponema sp.]